MVALVKLMVDVGWPLHKTWPATGFTTGVGFTVIVNVVGVPTQPLTSVRVTVIVATNGPLLALVVTNGAISPVPDAGRPMAGLLLVQLNTVPGKLPTVPLNGIVSVVAPVQYVLLVTAATVGTGFTVIEKVFE